MISSPLCELLGIEYPVFQGGMAWISDGELAAAVSNAGGLGIISAGNASAERVRSQIRRCRELTDRPFGVNVMLMSPKVEEVAIMLAEEKVPVLTTGAGNPSRYMNLWREAGSKIIPVIASSAMARMMTKVGAVAVIAEGGESGGHVGEISTMALVPQVCDVTDLPVIAAGGIGDGRGMAAAFMLGACGIQMGTRFLVAEECNVHPTYKAKILKAKDIDTIKTGMRLGHPVRSLKTPFSREYAKLEYTVQDNEELEGKATGALRRAAIEGDEEAGCFLAGQIAGMICREQTAADIVHEVCAEAEELLKVAPRWVI